MNSYISSNPLSSASRSLAQHRAKPSVSLAQALNLALTPVTMDKETCKSGQDKPELAEKWEFKQVLNSCHVTLISGQDIQYTREINHLSNTVSVVIALEGKIQFFSNRDKKSSQNKIDLSKPTCLAPEGYVTLLQTSAQKMQFNLCENNQLIALILDLSPHFLATVLEPYERSLFTTKLSNKNTNFESLPSLRYPITKKIHDVVHNLIQSSRTARFRQLLIESRCNDLAAYILQDVLSYTDCNNEIDMPVELVRSIQRAHQILVENITCPPTLDQLSRQIGVNRNKLCRGFKSLYGTTVYDYCQQYRMKLAQTLLQKGRHSIAHVAEITGYEHPSNFTTAYKRFYGELPKQARLNNY